MSLQYFKCHVWPIWTTLWCLTACGHCLLSLCGKEQLGYSLKLILLCSTEENKPYRFGITWRWVLNAGINLFEGMSPIDEYSGILTSVFGTPPGSVDVFCSLGRVLCGWSGPVWLSRFYAVFRTLSEHCRRGDLSLHVHGLGTAEGRLEYGLVFTHHR